MSVNTGILARLTILACFFASVVSAGQWTNIGPDGGGIHVITNHPAQPEVVYAGTNGGVYVSRDGGENWQFSGLGEMDINAIAIAPSDPETLYVAVVERENWNDWHFYDCFECSGGIYRSTDGGKNWCEARSGLEDPTTPEGDPTRYRHINSIAVDDIDADHVWLATRTINRNLGEGGLYESHDGGETWHHAAFPRSTAGIVTIDPRDQSTLWVSLSGNPSPLSYRGGLYKSVDGGHTWESAHSGLERTDRSGEYWSYLNIIDLQFPLSNPSVIYAVSKDEVVRSDDLGEQWNSIYVDGSGRRYLQEVEVDPGDADSLWLLSTTDGLMRTTNGGYQWRWVREGLGCPELTTMIRAPQANGELLVGNAFDGLYVLDIDATAFRRSDAGIKVHLASSVTVDPIEPSRIWLSSYKEGFFGSSDSGATWALTRGGGCPSYYPYWGPPCDHYFGVYIAPQTSTLYLTGWCGPISSGDFGETWDVLGSPDCSWPAFAVDPSDNNVLYSMSDNGLHRTSNGGLNWTPCSTELPYSVKDITVDPFDSSVIWVATVEGVVKSTDSCSSWHERRIEDKTVNTVLPIGDNDVLAGADDGLYLSDDSLSGDSGDRWQRIALKGFNVTALESDPGQPNRLFAATAEAGVWISPNRGRSWRAINRGLDNFRVTSLAFDSANTLLYASTVGSGVFVILIEDEEPRRPAGRH